MKYLVSVYLFLMIFRPFEYWPQLGGLHIQKVFMILLLAFAVAYRDKRFRMNPVHLWLFAFVGSLLFSTMVAWDPSLAWLTTWKYIKLVIFYLVVVLTIHEPEDIEFVAKAFLLVTLVYVGKSAWEYFVHGRYVYRMGIKRMIGVDRTYAMPNAFAATICFSLPVVWAMMGKGLLKRWMRLSMIGYLALAPVCIVMTGSRSGMVTGLFFLVMVSWRARRKVAVSALVAVFLLLGWQFVPEMQQRRFLSIFSPEVGPEAQAAHDSAQGRIEGLKHGFALLLDHPLLGVGPDNTRRTWFGGDGPQAHNLLGQIMGETGLLGTVTFFGFLAAVWSRLRAGVRKAQRLLAEADTPEQSRRLTLLLRLSRAMSMMLLLLLFSGIFGHNAFRYTWLLAAFFAVTLGEALGVGEAVTSRSLGRGGNESKEGGECAVWS